MVGGAAVVGVYRHRNTAVIDALRHEARDAGWSVRFWALDSVPATLADVTVGCGQRTKFDALNSVLATGEPGPGDVVVVIDDDVTMPIGGLARFVGVMTEAGLDIAQPAHERRSYSSHPITVRRRLSRARLTSYVEIGPVFAFSAAARALALPFPADIGMGWGMELRWADLREEGLRLGVVDDVTMRHLSPPALTYDAGPESQRLLSMLAERGVQSLGDLQRTSAVWRPWQSRPPWLRGSR